MNTIERSRFSSGFMSGRLKSGRNPGRFPSVTPLLCTGLSGLTRTRGLEPIRTPLRNNPNTVTTKSEQAHGAIRTPARTNPDTITTVPSKLYGFDRAPVRLQSKGCTLWIVTPYAFISGRRTDCSVIRTRINPLITGRSDEAQG